MIRKCAMPIAILLAAMGLILTGCSGDNSTVSPTGPTLDDIGDFFPLGVGYTWTYNTYNALNELETTWEKEILESHTFESGQTVYFAETPPGNEYMGWAADAEGLYYYQAQDLDESNIYLILPNPPCTGNTVTVGDELSFSILSLDTEVTCSSGTFSCVKIKVEYIDDDMVELYYLAKDIGIVRREEWHSFEFHRYDELTAYSLND